MIKEQEYMSSDVWKRNIPPVSNYKRGGLLNKFGMWVMWIFYGIVIIQVLHAITVIPFFPITFLMLLFGFNILFQGWIAR